MIHVNLLVVDKDGMGRRNDLRILSVVFLVLSYFYFSFFFLVLSLHLLCCFLELDARYTKLARHFGLFFSVPFLFCISK